jgi:hypothetical protein
MEAPAQLLKRGNDYLCEEAKKASRLPPGHPEAFLKAFANVYMSVAAAIRAGQEQDEPDELSRNFPASTREPEAATSSRRRWRAAGATTSSWMPSGTPREGSPKPCKRLRQ